MFNPPAAIKATTRDQIYQNLHHLEQLILPKTVRFRPTCPQDVLDKIEAEAFTYPVIFRQAGDHGGISTALIHSADEVEETMHQYALSKNNYYLTQFVDYANKDKLYHKSRLVVVGDEVFIRHHVVSDNWLIHAQVGYKNKDNKLLRDQENNFLKEFNTGVRPKIQSTISQIKSILKLDYFGIDCCLNKNNTITIFEINANMNIFSTLEPARFKKILAEIKTAVQSVIINKAKHSLTAYA